MKNPAIRTIEKMLEALPIMLIAIEIDPTLSRVQKQEAMQEVQLLGESMRGVIRNLTSIGIGQKDVV